MIKAKGVYKGGDGDRTIYIFGLSARNVEKLQTGDPILFDGAEMGIDGMVMITYGTTEETLVAEMNMEGVTVRASH